MAEMGNCCTPGRENNWLCVPLLLFEVIENRVKCMWVLPCARAVHGLKCSLLKLDLLQWIQVVGGLAVALPALNKTCHLCFSLIFSC